MSSTPSAPEPLTVGTAPLPTAAELPNDLETLKRMVLELLVTLREERQDKEALRHRIHLLLERIYGQRTERVDASQLLLFAQTPASADSEPSADSASAESEEQPAGAAKGKRRARPHGRRKLPDHLPRRPVHHELSAAERLCVCGQTRIDIGADNGGEQLDWVPASYFVWQHFIHKYLCPQCAEKRLQAESLAAAEPAVRTPPPEPSSPAGPPPADPVADSAAVRTPEAEPRPAPVAAASEVSPVALTAAPLGPVIVSARKPPAPIAKGLPGPGALAHFIVSKYLDHQPLYRQEHISEREGIFIPRSTSCDWMAACAQLLRPLYDLMVLHVLQSLWMHTDDTPVKNLGHAAGTTDKARFWIYWGDRTHPYNVYDFTINRKRDGPQTFLANYHGYLHADAFSGYDALYLPEPCPGHVPIREVACNAHARRKFYEARDSNALLAHQALAYYAQLYELERVAKVQGFDDEQRWRMRQDLAKPILEKFEAWLKEKRSAVLPKSPMAEAIGYVLNNWAALCRYTEAGYLEIDNNVAEREMKRIALGRKNWLFVGSEKGGETAAVLFSFTSTCHRLRIEPWAYLKDVLERLPTTTAEGLTDLLPDRWQAARKEASAAAANTPPDGSVP
jgi:transposase